jgi:hypothetical protein
MWRKSGDYFFLSMGTESFLTLERKKGRKKERKKARKKERKKERKKDRKNVQEAGIVRRHPHLKIK